MIALALPWRSPSAAELGDARGLSGESCKPAKPALATSMRERLGTVDGVAGAASRSSHGSRRCSPRALADGDGLSVDVDDVRAVVAVMVIVVVVVVVPPMLVLVLVLVVVMVLDHVHLDGR